MPHAGRLCGGIPWQIRRQRLAKVDDEADRRFNLIPFSGLTGILLLTG